MAGTREAAFLTGLHSSRDYSDKADGRIEGHCLAILSCKKESVN
jgi:hypothetical protein